MRRHENNIPLFNAKHDYFKISFFPLTIIEWDNLDSNIRNSESLAISKKRILALDHKILTYKDLSKFIRSSNSTFHCHSPEGLKLITSLRLGLSHLRFHFFSNF